YLEKVIKNTYSLVKCIPETGRTHQIRVHLAYINYPILGDEIYHKPYDNLGQRLHSYSLTFFHPALEKELTFFTPLGEKFNMIINKENDKNI
ncbi:MAG: RNA pseudouridine synthase, partial [Mycoplasma sp.]|nr:RNA pseudouridine synthase [Mycoplasma sp.]